MPGKANSVNIEAPPRYHHGNLRAAALALALDQLRAQDQPDLGLRAIARKLGVSASALYRHFAGKEAFLEALAHEGLRALGESQSEAARTAGDQRKAFAAVGAAYVEWALANPALFRLTFAHIAPADFLAGDPGCGPETSPESSEAARQLMAGIEAVLPHQDAPDDRAASALHAWALVHGLAHLILEGQIAPQRELIRAIIAQTFGLEAGG